MTTPTPGAIARDAIKLLKAKADPRKARAAQTYFKESVYVFGLSAPEVRAIALQLHRRIRSVWTADDAVALCDLLFPRPQLEAKGVATLVLRRFRREYSESLFSKAHKWLRADYLDNWASVDSFCPEIVGTLLQSFPRLVRKIEAWAVSPNRWVRRASIVSFIKLAKRDAYKQAVYAMARRHFASDDDLIHKATGWLLREAGKRDMEALESFLLRHGPRIPRTTLRYAIERFPPARRREMLETTRARRSIRPRVQKARRSRSKNADDGVSSRVLEAHRLSRSTK
ncbi:MAG: DNA alkylation repair protein [Vicinamibacteria bacterium]|nr:DNA alkylation repair protein [Vicinamibacteria bacterium]